MTQAIEIDPLEQAAQRIVVERIGLIWRPHTREHLLPQEDRIALQVPRARRARHRRWCEAGIAREAAHVLPVVRERLSRFGSAAAPQPIGQNAGVHRAGARSADTNDLESWLLQQPVEHAPSERAVRAATLQGDGKAPDRVITHWTRYALSVVSIYAIRIWEGEGRVVSEPSRFGQLC